MKIATGNSDCVYLADVTSATLYYDFAPGVGGVLEQMFWSLNHYDFVPGVVGVVEQMFWNY